MRRGDIVWVHPEPAHGSEAGKLRPAVVVSNDGANSAAELAGRGVLTVVPLTTNVRRVYPFQVLLPRAATPLGRNSKAEPVRAVDIGRVDGVGGRLTPELMARVDDAIRLHLGL